MGRPSVLLALLLMVFVADMVGNQATITRQILGYSFDLGRDVQSAARTVADLITTGR